MTDVGGLRITLCPATSASSAARYVAARPAHLCDAHKVDRARSQHVCHRRGIGGIAGCRPRLHDRLPGGTRHEVSTCLLPQLARPAAVQHAFVQQSATAQLPLDQPTMGGITGGRPTGRAVAAPPLPPAAQATRQRPARCSQCCSSSRVQRPGRKAPEQAGRRARAVVRGRQGRPSQQLLQRGARRAPRAAGDRADDWRRRRPAPPSRRQQQRRRLGALDGWLRLRSALIAS